MGWRASHRNSFNRPRSTKRPTEKANISGKCPVDGDVLVSVLFADGDRIEGRAEIFNLKRRSCGWPFWKRVGSHDDIIAFEILPTPR